MVAAESGKFCTEGESGDMSSIFTVLVWREIVDGIFSFENKGWKNPVYKYPCACRLGRECQSKVFLSFSVGWKGCIPNRISTANLQGLSSCEQDSSFAELL